MILILLFKTHSRQCIVETWHQKDWLKSSCAKSYSWFFFENAPSQIICKEHLFFADDRFWSIQTHSRQCIVETWTSKRLTEICPVQSYSCHSSEKDSKNKLHRTDFSQSFWCQVSTMHCLECVLNRIKSIVCKKKMFHCRLFWEGAFSKRIKNNFLHRTDFSQSFWCQVFNNALSKMFWIESNLSSAKKDVPLQIILGGCIFKEESRITFAQDRFQSILFWCQSFNNALSRNVFE